MALIVLSWCCGLSQHGVIVMCLHDSADVFLSASKAFSYIDYGPGVAISFVLFTLSWMICRLTLYPLKIIYPAFVYKTKYDCHPLYWVIVGLLSILMILHIYWGKFILPYAWNVISKKNKLHDPRSGSDNDNDEKAKKER